MPKADLRPALEAAVKQALDGGAGRGSWPDRLAPLGFEQDDFLWLMQEISQPGGVVQQSIEMVMEKTAEALEDPDIEVIEDEERCAMVNGLAMLADVFEHDDGAQALTNLFLGVFDSGYLEGMMMGLLLFGELRRAASVNRPLVRRPRHPRS